MQVPDQKINFDNSLIYKEKLESNRICLLIRERILHWRIIFLETKNLYECLLR